MTSPVRVKFPHIQHRTTGTLCAMVVTTTDQGLPIYNAVAPAVIASLSRATLLTNYHPADQAAFRIFRELISIHK